MTVLRVLPLCMSVAGLAMQANTHGGMPPNRRPARAEEHFRCAVSAASNPASLKPFSVSVVNGDHVFLNARVLPSAEVWFAVPAMKVLLITDLIVQNRAAGDKPVQPAQFSRIAITAPTGGDAFLSVAGNGTLSEHLRTAIVERSALRFYNLPNSSAPFVEVFITGVLRDCTLPPAR